MKLCETQAQFETLWFYTDQETDASAPVPYGMRPEDHVWVMYFTATWCKACKKLDMSIIENNLTNKNIPLWICDMDQNDYTPGYCGVRSMPTFVCFSPKKIIATLKSSDTQNVLQWIESLPS